MILIIAVASILINTLTIISILPYSNNDYICNIQMTIERIIHDALIMK